MLCFTQNKDGTHRDTLCICKVYFSALYLIWQDCSRSSRDQWCGIIGIRACVPPILGQIHFAILTNTLHNRDKYSRDQLCGNIGIWACVPPRLGIWHTPDQDNRDTCIKSNIYQQRLHIFLACGFSCSVFSFVSNALHCPVFSSSKTSKLQ